MNRMGLFKLFHLLIAVTLYLHAINGNPLCAHFEISKPFVTQNEGYYATLDFTVKYSCSGQHNTLSGLKVYRGSSTLLAVPECRIEIEDNKCSYQSGCLCDKTGHVFSLTTRIENVNGEERLLVGELENRNTFTKTVAIQVDGQTDIHDLWSTGFSRTVYDVQTISSTFTTEQGITTSKTATQITTDLSSTVPSTSGTPDVSTILQNNQFYIILFGSVGCAILFLGLFTVVGVLNKRRNAHIEDHQTSASVHSLVFNGLRNERLFQAGLSKELFRGSNVSLMITNNLYGDSLDRPSAASSLNVGLCEKMLLPSLDNCLNGNYVDDATHALPCAVNIATRERMPLPPEAFSGEDEMGAVGGASLCSEEGDYAEVNDLLDEINEAERTEQGKPRLDESY